MKKDVHMLVSAYPETVYTVLHAFHTHSTLFFVWTSVMSVLYSLHNTLFTQSLQGRRHYPRDGSVILMKLFFSATGNYFFTTKFSTFSEIVFQATVCVLNHTETNVAFLTG